MSDAYRRAATRLFDLERFGMKLGLSNTTRLMSLVGDPKPARRTVLIGGTNGKGSVSAMLSFIAQAHGWRTGLFTSPHLVTMTERIQVDGQRISPDEVVALSDELWRALEPFRRAGEPEPITFFELLTVMMALHFSRQNLDLAVVEVGLGGRLDATNVLARDAVVLTDIAIDHSEILGDSLAHIVAEKAALMRAGCPTIASGGLPGVSGLLIEHADQVDSPLFLLDRDFSFAAHGNEIDLSFDGGELRGLPVALAGPHQWRNAAVAVRAAIALGLRDEDAIRRGLAATKWPGRLEAFPGSPAWLLDCAHNPAGAEALAAALPPHEPTVWLAAMMGDKDSRGVLEALAPRVSTIVCTSLDMKRALPAALLGERAAGFGRPVHVEGDTLRAMNLARELAGPSGRVLATGSIFLVGFVRGQLTGEQGP